tara:strand:- start:112 stop:300 length:189 start_codon:yes stop_codon:yes gene_type:complete
MREVLNTGDGNLYQVIRVLKEASLKNPDTGILKKYFRCDTLLRSNGKLYFCNKIKEIDCELE